jgi:hypothetical protein
MDDIDRDKLHATLARLEAEREQRRAERIAAGELVSVPLWIVAGSEALARARIEETKAEKLKELREAGEAREIAFAVTLVVTGVCQHGEIADAGRVVPTAPGFPSHEDDRPSRPPPNDLAGAVAVPVADQVVEPAEPEPVIETYVCVQTRRCHDDDDPGEIAEGWFSVDASTVTVTGKSGGYIGSRVMLKGEDARVVAKQLLREKTPEAEGFNRQLSYPSAGLA